MNPRPDHVEIQKAIRVKYTQVAQSAEGFFEYATGGRGAVALGYDPQIVANAPRQVLESFCGVGNPFALGGIAEGETVLDIGCGAGFDMYIATKHVGPSGQVVGIDLTSDMVALAARSLRRLCIKNAAVQQGTSECLPYDQGTIDLVISNGVLNLSPRKELSFGEVFRVLKSGGRMHFADIVLDGDLPDEIVGSLEAWSD